MTYSIDHVRRLILHLDQNAIQLLHDKFTSLLQLASAVSPCPSTVLYACTIDPGLNQLLACTFTNPIIEAINIKMADQISWIKKAFHGPVFDPQDQAYGILTSHQSPSHVLSSTTSTKSSKTISG